MNRDALSEVKQPLETEYIGGDSEGVTWREETLYEFKKSKWSSATEHARGHRRYQSEDGQKDYRGRVVRLVHRDGTFARNSEVDYIPKAEDVGDDTRFDWEVVLPQPIDGVVGYILPKQKFYDRTKVLDVIDAIREKLVAGIGVREAVGEFGLIEQTTDKKGNTWFFEKKQDGSVGKLRRKGADNISLSKIGDGKFFLFADREGCGIESRTLNLVDQSIDGLIAVVNERYP